MNSFILSGTLDNFQINESKAGKAWGELILRRVLSKGDDQFIPLKVFGERAEKFNDVPLGSKVVMSGRITGREWNGKHYADFIIDEIDFIPAKATPKPSNTIDNRTDDSDEDLPF